MIWAIDCWITTIRCRALSATTMFARYIRKLSNRQGKSLVLRKVETLEWDLIAITDVIGQQSNHTVTERQF